MKKILIIVSAMICTSKTIAQMTTSDADGFGVQNKRITTQFGSAASKDVLDPYMAMNFTYSPKAIGYTLFGNSNFLRGYGTVGAGVTFSFLTNPKDVENNFFGQVTVGVGADIYNKSEFEETVQGKQSVSTGIGIKPSLNILLYGTTINNEESGALTVEGYFRAGKLSPSIGWLQVQYGLNKWLDGSLYYSNDFGPMAGVVFNNDQLRLFVGGGMRGGRIGVSISNF